MVAKSFPITLKDGKIRQLRYDWEALNEFERRFGYSIMDVGQEIILGKVSFLKLTQILWAGLVREDKELTIDKLEKNLLETKKLNDYVNTITEAFVEAFPDVKETPKNGARLESKKSGPGKST